MTKKELIIVHLAKKDGTLRVVIPKQIREELKIKAGDTMLVSHTGHRVIFKKVDLSVLS
ncbi:AbrB/MazE/SpoVT family DNA-binding domain-containing protein [Candidatus Nitrosotenuis aquarius]|uniref:AbrB/MazE/SpoVT family DNA-binding domain-containing protein n=1 Tax=Candidatus Nitrosotenuis aquarius TaxID=1846278 RepID=UPI0013C2E9E7|nr:AbrB/MazE/SpoVT family DNA-binding domain-containing protein [Candidatus Nitrosotenuis aquarius]